MHSPLRLSASAVRAFRREADLRRGKILSATFSMTYKCNLRCVTCGVWVRGETDNQTELTTAEILSTAAQLKDLGVQQILLVGSEPLLRRDAADVVDALSSMGFEVLIITNGTLLTDSLCERLVRSKTSGIVVSIDAVGQRHNEIRGQAMAYERATAGIARMQAVKKRLESTLPEVSVHATISALNTDALEDISGLTEELGVDVSYQLASESSEDDVHHTCLNGAVIGSDDFISREGSFLPDAEGVRRIRRFLEKPGILKKHPSLTILAEMSDEDIQRGRFPIQACYVLEAEILIDPYGDVHPCAHLHNYSYGNVKDRPIKEIWDDIKRRQLLDRARKELFPVCRNCCQHGKNFTLRQKAKMMLRGLAS